MKKFWDWVQFLISIGPVVFSWGATPEQELYMTKVLLMDPMWKVLAVLFEMESLTFSLECSPRGVSFLFSGKHSLDLIFRLFLEIKTSLPLGGDFWRIILQLLLWTLFLKIIYNKFLLELFTWGFILQWSLRTLRLHIIYNKFPCNETADYIQ